MPAGCKRASRGFLDSPVKPENDKNVSLLIAVLVSFGILFFFIYTKKMVCKKCGGKIKLIIG